MAREDDDTVYLPQISYDSDQIQNDLVLRAMLMDMVVGVASGFDPNAIGLNSM